MVNQSLWKKMRRAFVFAALGLVALWLNMAAPVWAMPQAPERAAQTAPQAVTARTGAASVFGIDDGGVISSGETTRNWAVGTGANWERISLYWSSLEPTQGNYNFTSADNALTPLLNKGFSLYVYLEMNPTWASNTNCGPVNGADKVAAFATMLGKLAQRYPAVKVWSAYNEVDFEGNVSQNNGGCFGASSAGGVNNNGVKDASEYAQMMAAAWKAIHAANPNALFSMGAVAYDNFNASSAPAGYPGGGNGGIFNYKFLSDLFTYMKNNPLSNGGKYMDLMAFNFYNIYGPYWQTKASGYGIQAKAKVLRNLMSAKSIPVVPLFVTETGEDSIWLGANGQARCLTMTMVRGAGTNLMGVTWWTFKDFPDSAPAPRNTWKYGVVDQNLVPKPAYTAFSVIANELNGFNYDKTMTNKTNFKGVEAYSFVNGGAKKIVMWGFSKPNPTDPDKPECSWARASNLANFNATTVRTVTYLGAVKTIKDNSTKDKNPAVGVIGLYAGGNPMIVQINP